jgi:hypothetical protein
MSPPRVAARRFFLMVTKPKTMFDFARPTRAGEAGRGGKAAPARRRRREPREKPQEITRFASVSRNWNSSK